MSSAPKSTGHPIANCKEKLLQFSKIIYTIGPIFLIPCIECSLLMFFLEWTLFQWVFCRIAIQSEKMVSAPKSTERPIANCKEWLSQLPGIIVQYWSPACYAPTMSAALCGEPIFSIFQPFEKPPIQSIFYTPYAKQLRGHTNTRGACYHILAPHNPFTAWVHFMNRLKIL